MIFYIPMLSQPPSRLMWVWSDHNLREMVWMTFHRCLTFELNINSHVYKSPPQDPFFVILLGRLLRNGWNWICQVGLFVYHSLNPFRAVTKIAMINLFQLRATYTHRHLSTAISGLVIIHHCRRWWQTICDSTPTHCELCCLFVAMWNHSGDRLWYNGRLYRNRLCSDHWWW